MQSTPSVRSSITSVTGDEYLFFNLVSISFIAVKNIGLIVVFLAAKMGGFIIPGFITFH